MDEFGFINQTGENIPAGALIRITGVDTSSGNVTVAKPDADSQTGLAVVGNFGVPDKAIGMASYDPVRRMTYDPSGAAPVVTDTLGSQNGQWLALKGNKGFRCLGGTAQGFTNGLRVDSDTVAASAPSSWKVPGVRLVAAVALPSNSYSNGSAGVGATLTGTSNGAISTQDAVTMLVNDDLLVTAEGVPSHNGIYTLTQVGDAGHPYILTRRADANLAALMPDATVYVREGQSYFNTTWQCTVEPPLTMGGTDLPWVLLNGARTGSDPVNTSNIGPFSDGTWTGGLTPYSCQLPGAGIYTICGCICGTGLLSAAGSQEAIISVRLTDGTTPLRGTKQILLSIRDTKQTSNSVSFAAPYTAPGIKTITIEAIRASFGATWSLGWPSVGPSAGDRETWLEYIRHR